MTTPEPCRVLIMDDDTGQARLAQRTLARVGYVVDLAPDGEVGLTQHAATPYDVLLIDHHMPGMGGLEVLETLSTWGAIPPTIMVTGHGDEAVAVEAMKCGASDYLVKDVEGRYLTLLPTVVARALQQRRLVEQKRQAEAALQDTLDVCFINTLPVLVASRHSRESGNPGDDAIGTGCPPTRA